MATVEFVHEASVVAGNRITTSDATIIKIVQMCTCRYSYAE